MAPPLETLALAVDSVAGAEAAGVELDDELVLDWRAELVDGELRWVSWIHRHEFVRVPGGVARCASCLDPLVVVPGTPIRFDVETRRFVGSKLRHRRSPLAVRPR